MKLYRYHNLIIPIPILEIGTKEGISWVKMTRY